VQVFDALWHIVGHDRMLRFVLIRDWPGHKKDDVPVTTDLSMTAEQVIENYCARWALENTFERTKGGLGFEDPHIAIGSLCEPARPKGRYSWNVNGQLGINCRLKSLLPSIHVPNTVP
jgi:hypothetical protein